jgi:hypothetical protein
VQIVSEAATAREGSSLGLELLLGNGRRLRVGPAFDAAALRRLLSVLEQEDRPCS